LPLNIKIEHQTKLLTSSFEILCNGRFWFRALWFLTFFFVFMLETTELITVFHRDSAFKIGNFLAAVILEDKIGLSSFSKNLKSYIIF